MGVAAAKVTDCLLIIIPVTYPSPKRYAKKQNPFVIIIEVTRFTIVWHLYFRHTEMVYHTHHQSAIILPALSRIFFQNICCPLFPHFPCSLFPYIDDLNSVAKTEFSLNPCFASLYDICVRAFGFCCFISDIFHLIWYPLVSCKL